MMMVFYRVYHKEFDQYVFLCFHQLKLIVGLDLTMVWSRVRNAVLIFSGRGSRFTFAVAVAVAVNFLKTANRVQHRVANLDGLIAV